jgi:acetylornithine deacetylase/succinyl-diaminopimelate desuccinylase-like protein
VDIRLIPPMTVEETLGRIEEYFAGQQGKAEYRVTKQGGPLDTPYDSPLVRALRDSAAMVLGREPPIASWRGWTEAESFQVGLGIDAVVFGPGALARAHSADEFVDLEEVRQAARVYAETALAFLGPGSS